ncbi:hypothetical protein B0A58_00205 [Flavobacterium branchiophilum NBRC 15030 = ATCC 35035]|uniref:Uncharacterized protein n=1 Tax=Flavobacterium branchiophilum TaxID=55197 RepID=A0A543G784_9FLAO|nr:hypothetical protein [Flavobacterium branchiophilum]OXA82332.1 hypothetical protein B0A58_00205 [Flavobacterium branchiophilum NBRC 15030 = ATCC 35035]TQM41804.1 hypothetical protein BC670_2814 [Flavobacterium branchiophilum]GEM56365.1 hypothetical protein FB1_25860 [Flavobacterium branchiophilum NBRC 15030 = ATCC 35035]
MDTYVKKILEDNSIEKRIDDKGNVYRIRVLGRGENLFFQENDNYLFCQIDAVNAVIFKSTIQKWDNLKDNMNSSEHERVSSLIEKYYKEIYNFNVIIKNDTNTEETNGGDSPKEDPKPDKPRGGWSVFD